MTRLTRQMDLIPVKALMRKLNIIGCGAIGSHTCMALAKMGLTEQKVWDFDDVDELNGNAQGFGLSDIGKPKVRCIQRAIEEHTGDTIQIANEKYEAQYLEGIVIAAVDSMEVRKKIWDKVKNNTCVDYFIDPRMSIEYALMYTVDPNDPKDVAMYEKTLYTDENSVQEPCTMKSVIFTAYFISGMVCKAVKDIITGGVYPRIVEWDIANDYLSIRRSNGKNTQLGIQNN
jgi:molybdopterin/thiamine biosynthesis adenylyltransferase